MKISDLKTEEKFREFLSRLILYIKRYPSKTKDIKKSIVDMNVENFYFYILLNLGFLFECFVTDSDKEDFEIIRKLSVKLMTMKKSEIMNFVRTKILVSDFSDENEYTETFNKVIPELFGYRFDLETIKKKYDLFNELYFNGELPNSNETDKIRFEYTNSNARKFGSFHWRYDYKTGTYREFDYRIKINKYYKGTELRIEGTLIHEMIHFYLHYILKDYDNRLKGHGRNFVMMCNKINTMTDNKYNLKRYGDYLQHI